ncbi:hypothetical protein B0T18DRAFT_121564 [Schizothecium vesticola]|uniref:Uncharacterized protein n=1 Tax=Schizothecium vesticola TaxID=314040 RepID=A0AA40F2N1_9PEZI|nr:hypothetical protein B0T18DRAFT_121564 [Schizothecium vesticola]
MPGNFVPGWQADILGSLPFTHQALTFYQRENLAPLPSLQWWGLRANLVLLRRVCSRPNFGRRAARRSIRPQARSSLLRHRCGMLSPTRFSMFFSPKFPGRLLILTPKLSCLDAPVHHQYCKLGKETSRVPRGGACFFVRSLVERRRQAQGWGGLLRALFLTSPPGAASTTNCMMRVAALFLCGLRILPWAHLALPPVSGPRIRNPEDSWRLACPGHSKRCG